MSWQEFGFEKFNFKWVLFSFILIFIVLIIGGGLSKLLSGVLGLDPTGDMSFIRSTMSNKLWLNILSLKIGTTLMIPFAEELLFRGLIFRYIRQEKSFIFSAILSSLLFSLVHFNLASLLFTFMLGLSTAFIYEKTKSILYPFLVHMGVNSLAINIVFLSII